MADPAAPAGAYRASTMNDSSDETNGERAVPANVSADERDYGRLDASDTLMAATRRLMLAATTASGPEQHLLESAGRLDAISAQLEETQRRRMRRVPFTEERLLEMRAGAPWRMFPYNALGIPQSIEVSGGEARSELRLQAVHEGPPGMLHGGFGAALLDAVLGVLVMAEVRPAVTAELTLSFHHPTPLDETIQVNGRIVEVRPRTIFAEGTITANGVVTVSARGRFVPVPMPIPPAADTV